MLNRPLLTDCSRRVRKVFGWTFTLAGIVVVAVLLLTLMTTLGEKLAHY